MRRIDRLLLKVQEAERLDAMQVSVAEDIVFCKMPPL
jgi:hypothetical protein